MGPAPPGGLQASVVSASARLHGFSPGLSVWVFRGLRMKRVRQNKQELRELG